MHASSQEKRLAALEQEMAALRRQATAERRHAEELRRLLIGELDHRVKNMLAMVRSLADQTLENVDSLAAFKSQPVVRVGECA
jgi:two-component sensor histidine kinase